MPQQLDTDQQIQAYLSSIFPGQPLATIRFEHIWVARPILTAEQIAQDMGLGLGNYVVDKRTGVVTAHPSLHPLTIGEAAEEAIRAGRPIEGRQVYPPTQQIQITRLEETPETVTYQVRIHHTQQPPQDYRLTITESTLTYQPNAPFAANVVSWTDWLRSQDGTWPAQGTFTE